MGFCVQQGRDFGRKTLLLMDDCLWFYSLRKARCCMDAAMLV